MEELPSLSEFRLATDIQAVLTVIGRRNRAYEEGKDLRLDLTSADLRTADLRRAQLQHAILHVARLEAAYLQDAELEDAYLLRADLRRACLHRVGLQGAHLRGAQLQEADFEDAKLQDANLGEAQLKGARHLTDQQLLTVGTLYKAQLDQDQEERIKHQKRSLFDRPSWWKDEPE
jgi:uncharacterized protein YjbI with pentapeptide repeats